MAAAARKFNWFAIWISVGVVVALVAVAGLVVWMNATSGGPGTTPESSAINTETGAIAVGEGEGTLDTYVDFMCPICAQFEEVYGGAIEELVDDGTITLNIHPIAILDRLSQGTEFSTRAASAMYCVADADPEASLPFMQTMFANQPAENTPGLTDEQMVEIAEGVGVTTASDCITSGRYMKFVTSLTGDTPVAPGSGGIGTPTIAVNGEVIANSSLPDPAEFRTLFE